MFGGIKHAEENLCTAPGRCYGAGSVRLRSVRRWFRSGCAATTAPEAAGSNAAAAEAGSTTEPAAAGDVLKVGFVYIGDETEAYTANFIAAEKAIADTYGDKVECISKYNVAEDAVEDPVRELCDAGCGIIFTTSFGYGAVVKELASEYPDVQFCQATCSDAAQDPVVSNYHNYMGEIYRAATLPVSLPV